MTSADDAYRRIAEVLQRLRRGEVADREAGVDALQAFRPAFPTSTYDFSDAVLAALRHDRPTTTWASTVLLAREGLRAGVADDALLSRLWDHALGLGTDAQIGLLDVLLEHLARFPDGTLAEDDLTLARLLDAPAPVLHHALAWAFANQHGVDLGGLLRPYLEQQPDPAERDPILDGFVAAHARVDLSHHLRACIDSPAIAGPVRERLRLACASEP